MKNDFQESSEIQQLKTWIANCEDQLAHMPDVDPPWFNIDAYVSQCGTYRCWLGDYMLRRYGYTKAKSLVGMMDEDVDLILNYEFGGDWGVVKYYGVYFDDRRKRDTLYCKVFSVDSYTTKERKAALHSHVDKLQNQLTKCYKNIEVTA